MSPTTLTAAEIEQFETQGFTYLRGAFSRQQAAPVLDQVWASLETESGVHRHDPSTWTQPRIAPKTSPTGPDVAALYTPRVRAAFDDLLGHGRWVERGDRTGAWPIRMPGFATDWASTGDWHIDGGGQRTLTSGSQALIAIMLFSDIGPGDGGTAVRVGSHLTSARALHAAGDDGLIHGAFIGAGVAASAGLPVVEAQGELGDLVLCHGYLVHSSSANCGTHPRIITNNCITLHSPALLDRPHAPDTSPYERTLRAAISP